MLGKSYKIVEPRRFDLYIDDIICNEGEAVVRIEYASICKADLRYYLGARDKRTLGFKYPMNLLHEAVGTIVLDKTQTFNIRDKVVLVPNIVPKGLKNCLSCICNIKELGENYCPHSKFASSNYNGFSREYVNYPIKNLVPIPENIDLQVATFSELISVAISICRRFNLKGNETIGIWGDGVLGYILCVVIRYMYSNAKVVVVGKHESKLKQFPAHTYYISGDKRMIKENISVAYECVGGKASSFAINEIVDCILAGGSIILTGVAEEKVEINTRKILEKGLSLYGATRSKISDFKKAVILLQNDNFRRDISKLLLNEIQIRNIVDFYDAFESELSNKALGRYILKFNV